MKKILLICLTLSSLLIQAQTTETFNYTGNIVTWTVPACVTSITITAAGAQGGSNTSSIISSGLGASMTGTFSVTPGQQFKLLVGEQPSSGSGNGGGGGSFVADMSNNPIIVAGGGAGSAQSTDSPLKHGQTTIVAGTGSAGGGNGGDLGNGGAIGASGFQSGAGGGFYTNGSDGWTTGTGGFAFVNGGAGAPTNAPARGGFGGGGSGSSYVVGGGGGGYSGGGSGGNSSAGVGGGGGSFNSGTNQNNLSGVNSGHGVITITYVSGIGVTPEITGAASVCEGSTAHTYSVTNDPSMTSYTWSIPNGFNLVSGQGTNSIVVDAGNTAGNISVIATDGCGTDFFDTLEVNVLSASIGTDVQSACGSYTWIDGINYTSSNNTATFMLQNAVGCDSLVTLDLTIYQSTADTIITESCGSYSLNGFTYDTTGIYVQTLQNVAGCDSILTLDLTVNAPTTAELTLTGCDYYILNGTTYNASGTYIQNLQNVAGCDSTLTFNLTIVASPIASAMDNGDGTITGSGGTDFQWMDCSTNLIIPGATDATFAPAVNGNYAVIVSENNCSDISDCIEIDNLSVNTNPLSSISLFPNPSKDYITVQFSIASSRLVIRDAAGKQIKQLEVTSGQSVQLNDLESGVYLFEFSFSGESYTYSVIKQ